MLPNVVPMLLKGFDLDEETRELPWPELAVVIGLILVLALEQVVVYCRERRERRSGGGGGGGCAEDDRNNNDHYNLESSRELVRSFLLVFALSLLSLLEGLAFGLETKDDKITTLFVALIAHKIVIAASLGKFFT